MLDKLDSKQRLRLMKFVCSFAWADLDVRQEELDFIARMMERLDLDAEERAKVKAWLEVPPSPDAIDPSTIPHAHRTIFLEAIEGVIRADGEIAPEERENLSILRELLES